MSEDIFRIADGTEMTPTLLAKYITEHEQDVTKRFAPLKDAYDNDYEIYTLQAKPLYKPDWRASANFARYITDLFVGFWGLPADVQTTDEKTRDYLSLLSKYNGQDDADQELSRLVCKYGHAYEIYYIDEAGMECTANVDPVEGFAIYSESIKPKMRYFVRVYTDTNNIKRGSISDASTVVYFDYASGALKIDETTRRPHLFGDVPATEYVFSENRHGIYEDVLALIDIYNKAICEKANDVDYFADAYLEAIGAKIDEETLHFMRSSRIINLPQKGPRDAKIDFLTKPSADSTQENLLDRLERLIFTLSMVCNVSDDTFASTSGIAIKYKMHPMYGLAHVAQLKFEAGMSRRFRLLLSHPVAGLPSDAWTTVSVAFKEHFPEDIADTASAVSSLSGIVSRRTQLSMVPAVADVDAEIAEIAKEQDADGYETDYPTERTGQGDET